MLIVNLQRLQRDALKHLKNFDMYKSDRIPRHED